MSTLIIYARVGRHEGTAVADLLVHRKEQRYLARKRHLAASNGAAKPSRIDADSLSSKKRLLM